MKNIESVKTTQAGLQLINELFAFEGSEPLTDELVYKLMRQGWKQSLFNEIQKIAPRFEHGGAEAYYSKKRNSILIPGEHPMTIVEITKTYTHFHALPAPPF